MSFIAGFAPFANGGWIFLIVIVVFTIAAIYGLFTRRGSGLNQRGYNKIYQGAPGARGKSRLSGRDGGEIDQWKRGTR
jgi:hypothetical protein